MASVTSNDLKYMQHFLQVLITHLPASEKDLLSKSQTLLDSVNTRLASVVSANPVQA